MKTVIKAGVPTGLALLLIMTLAGCKKEALNNLTSEETNIYISNYDSSVNFNNYKTFSVSDSVDIIVDNQSLGKARGPFEATIIQTATQIMQQRGYTLVDRTAKPDLAVNLSEVTNTTTGIFSYGEYWDSYGTYYDPYYWGYGGYGYYSPDFVGVYTIQSGGLEIDLLDLKNAAANNNKIKPVWVGLARGEGVFTNSNAAAEVTALFSQSMYLKTNN